MTAPALPLSTEISQSSSGRVEFKVLRCRYGNGYEQRSADGLNNSLGSWEVTWEGLTSTDFATIITALESSKGVTYFTWTAPGDASGKKWVVTQYGKSVQAGNIYTINATLQEVADITI